MPRVVPPPLLKNERALEPACVAGMDICHVADVLAPTSSYRDGDQVKRSPYLTAEPGGTQLGPRE